jgi:hypothetical protein
MLSGCSKVVLTALALATVPVATPAQAETFFMFPWFSPSPPERPRVTTPVVTAPAIRGNRVAVEPARSLFSQRYMVVGLGM